MRGEIKAGIEESVGERKRERGRDERDEEDEREREEQRGEMLYTEQRDEFPWKREEVRETRYSQSLWVTAAEKTM
ncbi:UNVERIFIED_CONTAM: hypothetical protein FKN15_008728 [Acipenser sinensis]